MKQMTGHIPPKQEAKQEAKQEEENDRSHKKKLPAKLIFIATGILSTAWFLFRVISKPSRITYPCVRATAPIAASFVLYLLSLTSGFFFLKKALRAISGRKGLAAGLLLLAMAAGFSVSLLNNSNFLAAARLQYISPDEAEPNNPLGEARGIHPGRVVWVWDPEATNENMTNNSGDYWFMDKNADHALIDSMLLKGLLQLSGNPDPVRAWDRVFRYFNWEHGKGNTGYQEGEKIFIKLNLTNSSHGMDGTLKTGAPERMDATPQFVLSLLRQLIEVAGVRQSDIYCGDTYRTFRDVYWDKCHAEYPGVHYVDGLGINGREQVTPSAEDFLFFSDGLRSSRLPEEYLDADYFINMSCLKSHNAAGITLCAKNHQGSYLQTGAGPAEQSAGDMHYCFPISPGYEGYGKYRHLVDFMAHEKLGGNTLLYIVDGLWAGRDWKGIVEKWTMEPFSGDYPSSVFLSLDPVAIECVGRDFLWEEYKDKDDQYPYYNGVDDYLLQAADPTSWPAGISYDPENDGTPIGSLGVYEHWNNATDKQYSRNLGTGEGIELFSVLKDTPGPDEGYEEAGNYDAYRILVPPVIDGIDDDTCWQEARWARIGYDWFLESGMNPPFYNAEDFSGRFKACWTEEYLYLLVEITDDSLNDDVTDPLVDYWEEDCIEIFIDQDHSGGEHRNNFNAFAYHTSPVTGDVVDIGTDGKPHLFNDHIRFEVGKAGDVYTCEYRIKIYNDTYSEADPEAARVTLQTGTMGFSVAYCEDDGGGRENFIGTVPGGLDSWKDADLLGQLNLVAADTSGQDTTVSVINRVVPAAMKIFPNPAGDRLHFSIPGNITTGKAVIYGMNGTILKESMLHGADRIDIGDLDNGMYVIVIEHSRGKSSCIFRKIN